MIFGIGRTVLEALQAEQALKQDGIQATVVNARFVKPIDTQTMCSLIQETPRVITVEENVLSGGFGSAILECLNDEGVTPIKIQRLGIPDRFVEHGSQTVLRSKYGLDAPAIAAAARQLLQQ